MPVSLPLPTSSYSEWERRVLQDLWDADEDHARWAVEYITAHEIRFRRASLFPGTGAAWQIDYEHTLCGLPYRMTNEILLCDDPTLERATLLSGLVHETVHHAQGSRFIPRAITLNAELTAWRVEFQVYHHLTGQWPGDPQVAQTLLSLTPGLHIWHPRNLHAVRKAMKTYSPDYLAGALAPFFDIPFYPQSREWIFRDMATALERLNAPRFLRTLVRCWAKVWGVTV